MGKKPEEKLVTLGDMTLGMVPLTQIKQRRENYKKMTNQQLDTLRASVDKFGFQTFLVVTEEPDGSYGIVDGHHRFDLLKERGAESVPVVVLPKHLTATDADLGMLSFNIQGEIQDEKFMALIKDLMADADSEDLRRLATLSPAFMEQLHALAEEPKFDEDDEPPRKGEGAAQKGPKAPKPLKEVVLWVAGEEGPEGPLAPAMAVLLPAEAVISPEVKEALAEHGVLDVTETEIAWLPSAEALVAHVEDLAAQADAEGDEEPEEGEED